MSGLRITLDDARTAVNTLAITFTLPKGATVDQVARVWVDALEGIEPGELRAAVKNYLKSDNTFFPKPGRIRAAALDYRRWVLSKNGGDAEVPWNQTMDGPCPVCGATLRLLTPEERGVTQVWVAGHWIPIQYAEQRPPDRWGVMHDPEQHRRANVPWVGFPDQLQEVG